MKKTYLAFISLMFLAGCATVLKTEKPTGEGQWRAKALVKDKEQSRSYIVNLKFNVVKEEKLRMDVTSALGTGVASLVVKPKEVSYILFDSKRFYYGAPRPDVMRPILSVPFDPRWLNHLLFETAIPDKSWTCTKGQDGLLAECKDSVSGVKITWSGRSGYKKIIQIDHNKASLQINVQDFQSKVEDRKNLFNLEAPEGYQKLQVR